MEETNTEVEGITCPKCFKQFTNSLGLRMHNARVHTGTIIVPKKSDTPERIRRREYQRQLRERYKREGRDSRGYWINPRNPKKKTHRWSRQQRLKYMRTLETKRKRITPFVYPLPQPEEQIQSIKFCPHCGNNIEKYL